MTSRHPVTSLNRFMLVTDMILLAFVNGKALIAQHMDANNASNEPVITIMNNVVFYL
jgi:hypothetical protein